MAENRQGRLRVSWNHRHPPKVPSKFEVWDGETLIYSGTYNEGMRVFMDHFVGKNEMVSKGDSLEVDSSPRGMTQQ